MKRKRSAAVGLVVGFVAMIAIVGSITYSNYEGKVEEELTKAKEEMEKLEDKFQTTQGDNVQSEIQEEPELIEPDFPIVDDYVQEELLTFTEEDVLSWPIDGNVILPYSMEQTIYFATLDQYKYNSAVMIAGEIGEEVWAATDGEVTSIETDAQTGTTVKINLGDGYEAVYGQLGELFVKEGERIDQGVLIGYLAEQTKYYSVEGSHLYFQLLKDGEPVNPLHFLDV